MSKIILGDCVEVMRGMADKSVDIIFTDPPYGVSFKKPGQILLPGDTINLLPMVLPEFYRILKDDGGIYIWSSTNKLHEFLFSFQMYFKLHNIIVWDKIQPTYPQSKAHYQLQYEPIMYGSKRSHQLKSKKHGDIISAKNPRGNKRVHPTQKPTEVPYTLLRDVKNEQSLVFDPFCGSGSILVAAKSLNMPYIGVDINPDYVQLAKERLKQEALL